MVVVDSSVWVDYFNDSGHPATDTLEQLLEHGEVRIVVPDLVLFQVLRGFRHERDLRDARLLLESFDIEAVAGADLARLAAAHYRDLRSQGLTMRSGIDVLIATFCIEQNYALLPRDPDFRAFESRHGLRGWQH